MKLRMPRYFEELRCLGSACPDHCCQDWAVVLDPDTVAFYEAVPGPLGDSIRASMIEEDGEHCFRMADGICPMLDNTGLCTIQRELGEAHLSRSCDLHPRFAEEYGNLREWSLSMACPEAVRLLLEESAPMTFPERTTGEVVTSVNNLDPNLFFALLQARKAAMDWLQTRTCAWQLRLRGLLTFAATLQKKLDQHRLGQLDAVTARFAAGRMSRPPVQTDWTVGSCILKKLQALEPINACWPDILRGGRSAPVDAVARTAFQKETVELDNTYEQLLIYFAYRHFLKAVNDRRVLARVQLAAVSILCIRELEFAHWSQYGRLDTADRMDFIHRYCREIEHSRDNLDTLFEWFAEDSLFAPESLACGVW